MSQGCLRPRERSTSNLAVFVPPCPVPMRLSLLDPQDGDPKIGPYTLTRALTHRKYKKAILFTSLPDARRLLKNVQGDERLILLAADKNHNTHQFHPPVEE